MIKKVFVGMTIALVLFAGIFAFAKTSFAQDGTTEVETEEVETEELEAPVMEALENEYQYQNGPNSGDVDAIMTQTRTRSRELVENGECTGECDPIQLQQRLNDGAGMNADKAQQRQNLGAGECDGTCVPQGNGPMSGAGNRGAAQGAGQGMGTGDPATCPHYNETTP